MVAGMTTQTERATGTMHRPAPRELVEPGAARPPSTRLDDPRMRLIAGYQLGWCDADGAPVEGGGGKAIRPALARAVGRGRRRPREPRRARPRVAVELVHNFSLLHDDIMDRDVERRHRPTGWVVFGDGQAILAGNAMLTAAIEVLLRAGPALAGALLPRCWPPSRS